jgi:D-sedoheptulose 7-phosphate isomerase
MENYDLIASGFQEVIELISVSVDQLVEPLEIAAGICNQALLGERKILCCGNGRGAAVAQQFSISLVHRFEQERPALPATCLSSDGAMLSALATAVGSAEIYARQVRALGQAGDVLLGVAAGEGNSSIIQAIRAAHDRDMTVIVLGGGDCADVSSLLLPEDIEVHVPSGNPARIIEMQTMIVHCLCKLIDQSLFGSYEQ